MRSLFEDLIGSFHSRPLYLRRLRTGSDTGFIWLLFVCVIAALPMTIRLQYLTLTKAEAPVADLIGQMPVLHFEDGTLHTDPAGPHLIMSEGEVVLVIDDSLVGLGSEYGKNHVLMTRDHLVTRQANGKVSAQPHDWIGTRDVTQDDLRDWWTWWQHWGWTALWISFFFVNYFGFGLLMLVMSLVALLLARLQNVPADYNAALRLTALAITPAILLNALESAAGGQLPFSNWTLALITAGFQLFALLAAQREPGSVQGSGA